VPLGTDGIPELTPTGRLLDVREKIRVALRNVDGGDRRQ
jgi:hypothetical protein